jgi:preprotein translocase subunit SecG
MITLLTIIHIIVSVFLILVVLLQQGKGQDFAGTFGGGGTQASFGARSSATLLHRLTTVAAIMFMITSLSLTVLISQPGTGSVISDGIQPVNVEPIDVAPVADEAAPPAADDAPPVLGETPEPEVETEN